MCVWGGAITGQDCLLPTGSRFEHLLLSWWFCFGKTLRWAAGTRGPGSQSLKITPALAPPGCVLICNDVACPHHTFPLPCPALSALSLELFLSGDVVTATGRLRHALYILQGPAHMSSPSRSPQHPSGFFCLLVCAPDPKHLGWERGRMNHTPGGHQLHVVFQKKNFQRGGKKDTPKSIPKSQLCQTQLSLTVLLGDVILKETEGKKAQVWLVLFWGMRMPTRDRPGHEQLESECQDVRACQRPPSHSYPHINPNGAFIALAFEQWEQR